MTIFYVIAIKSQPKAIGSCYDMIQIFLLQQVSTTNTSTPHISYRNPIIVHSKTESPMHYPIVRGILSVSNGTKFYALSAVQPSKVVPLSQIGHYG